MIVQQLRLRAAPKEASDGAARGELVEQPCAVRGPAGGKGEVVARITSLERVGVGAVDLRCEPELAYDSPDLAGMNTDGVGNREARDELMDGVQVPQSGRVAVTA